MLPTPTPEMLLILSSIKQQTGQDPAACSARLRGIRDQLLGARRERRVVMLRELVPEINAAQDGAESALRALCVVCPSRQSCPAPLK